MPHRRRRKRDAAAPRPGGRPASPTTNREQDGFSINQESFAMAAPVEQQPVVDEAAELEDAVHQAIEACGGDPVDAVRDAHRRERHARAGVGRRLRQGFAGIPAGAPAAEAHVIFACSRPAALHVEITRTHRRQKKLNSRRKKRTPDARTNGSAGAGSSLAARRRGR